MAMLVYQRLDHFSIETHSDLGVLHCRKPPHVFGSFETRPC